MRPMFLSRRPGLLAACLVFNLVLGAEAGAAFNSGSTGADGAFNPTSTVTIDLALAGTGPGTGTYDAARWAVIFNYTTINVPAGVQVKFKNHPSGAPVVWLATGNVVISGFINLNGATGVASWEGPPSFAVPGPGGFAGGKRQIDGSHLSTAGFGPGGAPFYGGATRGGGAGYATPGGSVPGQGLGGPTYGNVEALPLIGGSGGAASTWGGGGAGGGAILIASSADIVLNSSSSIQAYGGVGGGQCGPGVGIGGGGSGGTIRLMTNRISGTGTLIAVGGISTCGNDGGFGRIRVEADTIDIDVRYSSPPWEFTLQPGPTFPGPSAPTLTATLIGGQTVPSDPGSGMETNDVVVTSSNPVTVNIVATNIPTGTIVDVVLVPDSGPTTTVSSTPLVGSAAISTATASVVLPRTVKTEIFLRATLPSTIVTSRATPNR